MEVLVKSGFKNAWVEVKPAEKMKDFFIRLSELLGIHKNLIFVQNPYDKDNANKLYTNQNSGKEPVGILNVPENGTLIAGVFYPPSADVYVNSFDFQKSVKVKGLKDQDTVQVLIDKFLETIKDKITVTVIEGNNQIELTKNDLNKKLHKFGITHTSQVKMKYSK